MYTKQSHYDIVDLKNYTAYMANKLSNLMS